MVKFESPTLNSEFLFSRDQLLSYPTTLVPVAAGDKSTHTCTFFKLSHFIALLAECTESSSARVSSQDIAFASKLLWYHMLVPVPPSEAPQGRKRSSKSPAHKCSLTLPCHPSNVKIYMEGSEICYSSTLIKASNKFSLLPSYTQ